MKFIVAIAAAAVGANAMSNGTWAANKNSTGGKKTVTEEVVVTSHTVVTSYETYCHAATELVENGKTITVTAPGTVTVTDCPCTRPAKITKTVTRCIEEPTTDCETPPGPGPTPAPTTKKAHPNPPPAHSSTHKATPAPPPAHTTPLQGGAGAVGLSAVAGVAAIAAYLL